MPTDRAYLKSWSLLWTVELGALSKRIMGIYEGVLVSGMVYLGR